MDTEIIKQEIKKLIEKYNKVVEEKRVSRYNEEMTKKDFILPLFRALGWDTEDSNEVTAEEKISKKRVDYGFRINGIPKFFLEAKSLKEDLDNSKFVEQAINYAWHKGCTWAVLTDFESVKIFNAEWKTSNPLQSHLKTIPCHEFLDRFNELWLLSRESFERGLIDKEAEKWGKKTKKTSVDKQLLADFTRFRELLSKNITKLNQNRNLSDEDLDESIQRFLDRLIFIRNCEDRELEKRTLISGFREWESGGRGQLIKSLREIFAYFDKQYNSKIFANHLCDSLDIDDEVLHEIIEGLYYTKDRSVSYDFSAIEADVLGNIYEQYLGHILKKSEKRAKLTESHAHRKEQGIYYTPTYIVDYIVKNTLGELLKDKKVNPEKIRVLDPACGSGSFLIKAFDVLNEHYAKHDKNYSQTQLDTTGTGATYSRKLKILQDNIFGVDSDKQAVEIAQLNLLLKIAERGRRLPLLQQNIKCGNSLIEDPKVAGIRAFKWNDEFKDVMEGGGFDVVAGNPPYLKEMDNKEIFRLIKKGNYEKYYQGKMDFWYFFLHRAIDVVKEGGFIGFITNSYFLKSAGASKLIKRIKDELVLIKAVDFDNIKVFGEVSGKHIIHIYQKRKSKKADKSIYIKINKETFKNSIDEKNKRAINYDDLISEDNKINFDIQKSISFKNCNPLGDVYDVSQGVVEATDKISNKAISNLSATDFKAGDGVFVLSQKELDSLKLTVDEKKIIKKYLNTSDVGKYSISFNNQHLIYSDKEFKEKIKDGEYPNIKTHLDRVSQFITSSNKPYGLHRPRKSKYFENPKLICKGMFLSPEFYYDEDKYHVGFSFSVIIQKCKDYRLKYLLGVLNSKIGGYWFNINGKKRGIGVDIGVLVFRQFPIRKANIEQQVVIEKLVDKMLSLNKRLNEIGDKKTDERARIEEEIKKTDAEIDELVYKIYDITEEERKIIEESLK